MKSEEVYLNHVLQCIRRVEQDVKGGKPEYLASHMVQDAVLRNLQTLGESTQRLSEQVKGTQPSIEWGRISAFRNLLVHNYLGIDLDIVWDIVERDLPQLKKAVLEMREYVAKRAEE